LDDLDAAEHALDAKPGHSTVAQSSDIAVSPMRFCESVADELPPPPDSIVPPEGFSFRLCDHRRELDFGIDQGQEAIKIVAVNSVHGYTGEFFELHVPLRNTASPALGMADCIRRV
jgi:hypothetical protein